LRPDSYFASNFRENVLALLISDIFGSCMEAFYSIVRRTGELGGSVAEWLACWTRAQKGPGSNRSHDADVW